MRRGLFWILFEEFISGRAHVLPFFTISRTICTYFMYFGMGLVYFFLFCFCNTWYNLIGTFWGGSWGVSIPLPKACQLAESRLDNIICLDRSEIHCNKQIRDLRDGGWGVGQGSFLLQTTRTDELFLMGEGFILLTRSYGFMGGGTTPFWHIENWYFY